MNWEIRQLGEWVMSNSCTLSKKYFDRKLHELIISGIHLIREIRGLVLVHQS